MARLTSDEVCGAKEELAEETKVPPEEMGRQALLELARNAVQQGTKITAADVDAALRQFGIRLPPAHEGVEITCSPEESARSNKAGKRSQVFPCVLKEPVWSFLAQAWAT